VVFKPELLRTKNPRPPGGTTTRTIERNDNPATGKELRRRRDFARGGYRQLPVSMELCGGFV
jgi:hypothetical protein